MSTVSSGSGRIEAQTRRIRPPICGSRRLGILAAGDDDVVRRGRLSRKVMNPLSIIIPSKTDANLGACVRAIRAAGETATVIVVDDFDGPTRFLLPCDEPVDWQMGVKPFVFARNINIGIQAAAGDVVLLNDDAMLKTPHGFTAMQRVAAAHPEYGLIAATCKNVGNRSQWPQARYRGARRATHGLLRLRLHPAGHTETVGLLDERFVGYGCDDDDYCLRVRKAGLKIGIFDGCFVDHSNSREHIPGTRPGRELPAQPEGVRREVGSAGGRAGWEILIST